MLRLELFAVASVLAFVVGCPKANPTLTVDLQGDGNVKSLPAGIDCPPTCNATFPSGTAVSLKATGTDPSTTVKFEIGELPPSTQPLRVITLDQDRRVTVVLKPGEATMPTPNPVSPGPSPPLLDAGQGGEQGTTPRPAPPIPVTPAPTPTKPAPVPPG